MHGMIWHVKGTGKMSKRLFTLPIHQDLPMPQRRPIEPKPDDFGLAANDIKHSGKYEPNDSKISVVPAALLMIIFCVKSYYHDLPLWSNIFILTFYSMFLGGVVYFVIDLIIV